MFENVPQNAGKKGFPRRVRGHRSLHKRGSSMKPAGTT